MNLLLKVIGIGALAVGVITVGRAVRHLRGEARTRRLRRPYDIVADDAIHREELDEMERSAAARSEASAASATRAPKPDAAANPYREYDEAAADPEYQKVLAEYDRLARDFDGTVGDGLENVPHVH